MKLQVILEKGVIVMARRKTGRWSRDEISVLKKMYANTSTQKVATKLNRKIASVQAKAFQLGLKKTRKYLKSIGLAK